MSRRRDVLLGLKALASATLPAADIRGFDGDTSVRTIGLGGTVIGHPGDPGEPEVDLSPLSYNYAHRFPIEMAPPPGTPDQSAVLDTMMGAYGAAIAADRTLGGLCDWVEVSAADEDDTPVKGAATQSWGVFDVIANYSTPDPLN